uniref:Uncharacterized protein n=1 Tax=Anguilla anguilla TaxID=7936 RepID=A0A0E9URH5_ANGAN
MSTPLCRKCVVLSFNVIYRFYHGANSQCCPGNEL